MADSGSSIFNKRAAEQLQSPDDLDKYVRVTNPSVWIILLATVALVFGLLAWGIFGTVSSSVNTMGVVLDDQVMCFLSPDQIADIQEGSEAYLENQRTTIRSISAIPVSRDEAQELLKSDYLTASLFQGDWAYVVQLEPVGSGTLRSGIPIDVSITTERVAPISFIFDV